MTETLQLIACPFCTCKAVELETVEDGIGNVVYAKVECPACLAGGPQENVVKNAIDFWNQCSPFDEPEITALLNMIDHHLSGASPDAAPSPEMAALTRARAKLENAKGQHAQRYAWPRDCKDPESCARHGCCMYLNCVHDGRKIEDEIQAATRARKKLEQAKG